MQNKNSVGCNRKKLLIDKSAVVYNDYLICTIHNIGNLDSDFGGNV